MRAGTVTETAVGAHLGAVFTRGEALRAGITPAQLRGPAVRPVFRGVFTLRDDPASLEVRARGALKLAGPAALVCETTGLALLGVALPDAGLADTVHVWVPPRAVAPQTPGVRVHQDRLINLPKQVLAGVATVSPAECWRQAAAHLSVRDLVVLADGLTRRNHPILFLDDLRTTLAGAPGRRGLVAARRALALAREGTDSPRETVLRLTLVEAGLPCPVVNHPVRGPRGGILYYLDLAYPDALVAVEYDGAGHVADAAQMRRDQSRRRQIEDLGWRLVTATAADLADPEPLVASVRRALAARLVPGSSRRGGPPRPA